MWKKAATQGHARSQGHLGLAYQHYEGFMDYVEAYAWFSAASAQGRRPSITWKGGGTSYIFDTLKEDMTPEQLAEGKELANIYVEKYVVPFQKD